MLSDKFLKEEEFASNSKLSEQINKLEELSVAMTKLIENGNSQKLDILKN